MSLTAVQAYVASQLQGLVGAYNNQPLEAWVEPPAANASAETPQAYVLAAELEGRRQTMAAMSGYYQDIIQVYVYLEWMMAPGLPNGNLAFTNLIDTAITTIRTNYTGAIFITDPVTSQQCQLLVIGDKLSVRYLPQHSVGEGGQEWMDYVAQIKFEVQVKEQYA